jgi:hypothetical protein
MRNFSSTKKAVVAFGIAGFAAAAFAGCNLYSAFDKPSGDEQILSKARACFDQNDFDCARSYYAQLSTSYADVRASEEAFMILAENGATMAAFMETFGSGGSGQGLTELAERMAPGNITKRRNIQDAYKKFTDYTTGSYATDSLRQLVRYVTATALAAELLAENIPEGGALTKNLIVTNSTCSANACNITGDANCDKASSSVLGDGNGSNPTILADLSGTVTLEHFKAAMSEIYTALESLAAAGGFSTGSKGLADSLDGLNITNNLESRCFRRSLLEQGIGR